jgi:hypothetical protein
MNYCPAVRALSSVYIFLGLKVKNSAFCSMFMSSFRGRATLSDVERAR